MAEIIWLHPIRYFALGDKFVMDYQNHSCGFHAGFCFRNLNFSVTRHMIVFTNNNWVFEGGGGFVVLIAPLQCVVVSTHCHVMPLNLICCFVER